MNRIALRAAFTAALSSVLLAHCLSGCSSPTDPRAQVPAIEDFSTYQAALDARAGNTSGLDPADRMGMPAVNTALITSKDVYNASGPLDDIAGTFVAEITANIAALHAALDDDLIGLGLTPCATQTCVGQGAPLIIPDAIQIDTTQPSGFPNGRRLEDPVIDVTLAVLLLDLGVHDVTTLVGVNPTENDKSFRATFPYLAPYHRARRSVAIPGR